ncbi:TolC family protein [Celeribacter halophilus]|uniref:TolC family protein n=1 Tax=Celeribacter halophilus TaxID=576117 RepID=UPI003A8DE849
MAFGLVAAGLMLAGCAALPEPDGMEAALIERAKGLEELTFAKGENVQSVAHNGLLRNPEVREAANLISASADEVRVQRAEFFPSLGLSAGGGIGDAGDGKASMELEGSQLLFDGGKSKRAVKIADVDLQISYIEFQQKVDDTLIDLLEAYDTVQMNIELLAVYRQQLDARTELEALVTARAQNGAVSATDVLETQRRIRSAAFLVNETKLALAEARDRLTLLSGQSSGGRITLPASSCKARGATDDMRLARLELGRARLALASAEKALSPRVKLQPVVRGELGVDKFPVGLNIDIQSDLLKGGALTAKANQDRNTVAAAEARLAAVALEDQIEQNALERSLSAGRQKTELLQQQIALLSKTRDLYRSQYFSMGTRQLSELLDNEEEFYDRKAELVQLKSELLSDRVACAARSGQLRRTLGLEGKTLYGYPLTSDVN